jgi:HAD superfamily phosphatase (TIGR01668 family)
MLKVREFAEAEFNPSVFNPTFWRPGCLVPDEISHGLEYLDPSALLDKGIRGLAIDYDGVVTSYHSSRGPDPINIEKLGELRKDFGVCILSNRKGRLLKPLGEHLPGYDIIGSTHMKPHPEQYEKALKHLGLDARNVALLDDRLLTGVAGGKMVGMYTIWVTPPELEGDEPFNVRAYRTIEESLLGLYRRLGLVNSHI